MKTTKDVLVDLSHKYGSHPYGEATREAASTITVLERRLETAKWEAHRHLLQKQQLLTAIKKAAKELNEIRARDGVPYTHQGVRASVDEDYFSSVVDECYAAIQAVEASCSSSPISPIAP